MVLRKCTICDRRFKKTEHFKRHERSHTKERPYECNVCHKRFSRSDVLSRHAKGHNTQGAAVANGPAVRKPSTTSDQSHSRRPSTIPGASSATTAADNDQYYLPGMGTDDARALQNVPVTPQQMPLLAATAIPPSSLDFLADISTNHARTEPEVHPMMVNDQQTYLGWNEMGPINQPSHRQALYGETMPNDLLQLWLEPRGDTSSHHGSLDPMRDSDFGLIGDNFSIAPDRQYNSVDTVKSDNIPNERFDKVQRFWIAPSLNTGRLINSLWRDIACSDVDNLFTTPTLYSLNEQSDPLEGSRYGLDVDCVRRLQATFSQGPLGFRQSQHSALSPTSALNCFPNFPPAEILDMALDLYFRNFHPLIPFVHLPTFSAKKTQLPLLYVMCLIGMIMLDTMGATTFVVRNFSSVLGVVTAELGACSVGNDCPLETMSTLATTLLFLNLAAMTGKKEHIEQCQMLYVSLMSIAQRNGLFAATEGQILDLSLFKTIPGVDMQWNAWSKVESAKRLIAGLLLLDSSYSSFLTTSPIIVPDSIQLILPCNEALFHANCSTRWAQLIDSGKRMLAPTVMAPSENIDLPTLDNPIDDFSMHAMLAIVQLRLSEAYHRLLSNRASYPFAPCHTYAMDGRARCLPSLQLQTVSKYGEVLERLNADSIVMWHNMGMMLTADIQIFHLAAGRAGPIPASQALQDIAAWSQTPAARRACLHAAHIYKSMVNRKAADHPMFHSVSSLFSAALILGLYTFMVPSSGESQFGGPSIELLDNVDWQKVGTEGFTSFMEPRGSQPLTPADDPAVNFIRNGGTVYLRGTPFQGGYQSARRILLDYAGLLKDTGKWSVRKFSYVLHIMSDVLMDVE